MFLQITRNILQGRYPSFSLTQLGGKKMLHRSQDGGISSGCPFRYAGIIGPDILSGILVRAAGKSFLDFVNEHLFMPLGIDVNTHIIFKTKEEQMAFYKNGDSNGWVSDVKRFNTAGLGLNLSALEMAVLGQLYADNGIYNGQQIVSENWVKKSTAAQSYCKQFKLSYGYFWWLLDSQSFAAMGDSGNIIYVNRDRNIVISLTGTFVPNAKIRIDLIKKDLEPLCV